MTRFNARPKNKSCQQATESQICVSKEFLTISNMILEKLKHQKSLEKMLDYE